ncbi:hypothetical protein [Ruminococcus sp.]|uniref:hypothetical protein n=1 Tax=Ruminococcus sp. TaxID=41978 RepID=UPI001B50AD6E|nr:hypothetical protein [Ruminococcus sp.]MBP5430800.1 hypothetical protein [Ruminococcus sp.]
MLLTDIDGVVFEIDYKMVKNLRTRKKTDGNFTEVETVMKDYLQVLESPAEIIAIIDREKSHAGEK